jgi:hypothetical protein
VTPNPAKFLALDLSLADVKVLEANNANVSVATLSIAASSI